MKSTLTPSFLAWRNRARLSTLGAVAILSTATLRNQSSQDDRDAAHRIGKINSERVYDNDSIADTDKIEATVSSLERDTEPQGFAASATLSRAEKTQLAREVAVYRQFRADVRALPLLLTA